MEMEKINATTETLTIERTSYKRASVIGFYNPHNAAPYLSVTEETVVNDTPDFGQSKNLNIHNIPDDFEVPLINPITGAALGKNLTLPEIMTMLYSVYVYARANQGNE